MDGHRGFVSVFSSGVILIILASVFFLTPVSRGDFAGAAHGGNAGGKIIFHAAGRGDRRLSLQDGHELPGEYSGPAELVQGLRGSQVRPLSLASGDFDGDGVGDLISGYGRAGGGLVTVHRGNGQSRFPQGEAAWRQMAEGRFDEPAFLMPARVFGLPEAPDYLGVGDFNRDGRPDVVAGARGGESLYLLAGDGAGGLAPAERLALPGSVTALAVGEVNRPDGLPDVVVGLTGRAGPEVLMFQSLEGAWRSEPETVFLQAAARGLALGRLDDDEMMDVAVTAGDELVIIHGQDRTLLEVAKATSEVRHRPLAGGGPEREQMSLPFAVVSVAVGDFIWDRAERMELAVLDDEGRVHLMTRGELDRRRWSEAEMRERQEALREEARERAKGLEEAMRSGRLEEWQRGRDEEVGTMNDDVWSLVDDSSLIVHRSTQLPASLPQLRAARLGGGPTEELLVVDPAGHRVHILSLDEGQGATGAGQRAVGSLELTSAPIDVLPLQLNVDGERDLVVLRAGSAVPAVALTAAAATFMVTKTADTADGTCGADCSLREAIIAANATPGSDMIMIPAQATPYTLTIAGTGEDAAAKGDLDITESVTLMGAGQAGTTIEAGTTTTNGIDRVFQVIGSSSVTFEGVTIRHGRLFVNGSGGGIFIQSGTVTVSQSTVSGNSAKVGGGIFNSGTSGTLTVSQSTVSGNSAVVLGGGIENFTTVALSNSTVSGNTADFSAGGIENFGTVALSNTTVSGNSADVKGGGIRNRGSGTVTVSNSTVTDNSSPLAGGIMNDSGTVMVSNSIVANSPSGGNCSNAITSLGHNIDSDGSCGFAATGDMVADPLLGPLQDNGGPTETHALLEGSPAIDAGNAAAPGSGSPACEATDQRGVSRPVDGDGDGIAVCDIGAVEAPAGAAPGAPTGRSTLASFSLMEEKGSRRGAAGAAPEPSGAQALLVAEFDQDQVRVLLGQGDGTFRRGRFLPVGDGPSAMVLGDLNRDGLSDAVIANLLSNNLSILLGQGGGTFQRQRLIPVGRKPSAVAVGDFTGDGVLDVVVANFDDDTILVLTGRGDGTFGRGRRFPVGDGPTGLAVVDLDRDGLLDLAVSNFGSNDVTLLLGGGDGRFRRSGGVFVDAGPVAIAAADFDGDGQLELVTADFTANEVTLLKAGGRRGFRVDRLLPAGDGPVTLVAGAFLTGELGLAVADLSSEGVRIYLGNGTGELTRLRRGVPGTAAATSMVAGDFNQDGRVDLAVLEADGETLRVLLDNGDGTFRRAR